MTSERWNFSDTDLEYLVDFFMPNARDKERQVRMLRHDPEMLNGMLGDSALAEHMFSNAERIVRTSPALFFAILLRRVREDISKRSYTFEHDSKRMMIIFDTEQIVDLLSEEQMLSYLSAMLASFVKIHSHTVSIRVRRGIWRRLRFSDFDVDGLIRYLDVTDEEFRFPIYRRIADVSLFMAGVFGSQPESHLECGRRYYRAAAAHQEAQRHQMDEVLEELADHVEIAAKPLNFMADHYLSTLQSKVFSLPE
jgi:hypothetical protein